MYTLIDNEELSLKAHRILYRMLRDDKFAGQEKLPPENVLVEKLGVSRSVIRDALSMLESEGFITRKRGIGTVINWHVLEKTPRLDLENDFLVMLEEKGYKASIDHLEVKHSGESEKMQGARLLIEKRVMAGNTPAIFIRDHIYEDPVKKPPGRDSYRFPVYLFLRKYYDKSPELVMLDLAPRAGQAEVMKMLDLKETEPYLEVSETGYDLYQNILIRSTLYYRADLFNFSILRKELISHEK